MQTASPGCVPGELGCGASADSGAADVQPCCGRRGVPGDHGQAPGCSALPGCCVAVGSGLQGSFCSGRVKQPAGQHSMCLSTWKWGHAALAQLFRAIFGNPPLGITVLARKPCERPGSGRGPELVLCHDTSLLDGPGLELTVPSSPTNTPKKEHPPRTHCLCSCSWAAGRSMPPLLPPTTLWWFPLRMLHFRS